MAQSLPFWHFTTLAPCCQERREFMIVIYKITNLVNNKIYVGKTKRRLEKRFAEHAKRNYLIGYAIRKYGANNFKREILAKCETNDLANEMERYFIKLFDCKVPNGYNLTDGGDGARGCPCSEERRKKVSAALKGRHLPEWQKRHLSLINTSRKYSEEDRKKMLGRGKGEKRPKITGEKISRALLERPKLCRKSVFWNLLQELNCRQITYIAIAKVLGVTPTSVSQKMRGVEQFKLKEMLAIREFLNIDTPLDELFQRYECAIKLPTSS